MIKKYKLALQVSATLPSQEREGAAPVFEAVAADQSSFLRGERS
jgi:hypothetical protein